MENGESTNRSRHTTLVNELLSDSFIIIFKNIIIHVCNTYSVSKLLILVVSVFVHSTSSLEVTRLARSSNDFLLERLTTIPLDSSHPSITNNLRSKLLNDNGVLNIKVKALSRPLIADGDVVDIPTHFTPSSNRLLLTDVVHTVGNGERVVAADVVAGGIHSLEIRCCRMRQNYLLDDQGRSALSESNKAEDGQSFELEITTRMSALTILCRAIWKAYGNTIKCINARRLKMP